jgi:hypothetical protein
MTKSTLAPYGIKEHRAAIARGKLMKSSPTAVLHASYDAASEYLTLELRNGARVALPVHDIRELHGHAPSELADVEVSPARDGLLWRSIDVGI